MVFYNPWDEEISIPETRPIRKSLIFFSLDSLTIHDGDSSTSPIMGKYCDDSIPPSHISSSNKILIHFQSDGSVTRAGFQMEYHPRGKQNQFEYHKD